MQQLATIKKINGGMVPTTRVGPKHQVTIPGKIFKALQLEVGDYLDVRVTEEGIFMLPKKLVPKDQAWFYTKEWQAKEREADEAIARGEISNQFETVDELISHLRKSSAASVKKRLKR